MADHQQPTTDPAPTRDPKAPEDYIQFPCLPPGGPLNRWSAKITREHDYPGAQVCCWVCLVRGGGRGIRLPVSKRKLSQV